MFSGGLTASFDFFSVKRHNHIFEKVHFKVHLCGSAVPTVPYVKFSLVDSYQFPSHAQFVDDLIGSCSGIFFY